MGSRKSLYILEYLDMLLRHEYVVGLGLALGPCEPKYDAAWLPNVARLADTLNEYIHDTSIPSLDAVVVYARLQALKSFVTIGFYEFMASIYSVGSVHRAVESRIDELCSSGVRVATMTIKDYKTYRIVIDSPLESCDMDDSEMVSVTTSAYTRMICTPYTDRGIIGMVVSWDEVDQQRARIARLKLEYSRIMKCGDTPELRKLYLEYTTLERNFEFYCI